MSLRLVPSTIKAAKAFVAEHHRHSRPPNGGLFAVAVAEGEEIVGVAIAARPVARMLQDGFTVEISRNCTDGTPNAPSMLYSAVCRMAKAGGYRRAVTYTLASEPGTSLRACGFKNDRYVPQANWDRPSRPRRVADAEGVPWTPPGDKLRWVRML